MSPVSTPPPPAVHQPVPAAKPARSAENFRITPQLTQAEISRGVTLRKGDWDPGGSHALNIQAKHKHTNRLHSRKQAKLRAKRKGRR